MTQTVIRIKERYEATFHYGKWVPAKNYRSVDDRYDWEIEKLNYNLRESPIARHDYWTEQIAVERAKQILPEQVEVLSLTEEPGPAPEGALE